MVSLRSADGRIRLWWRVLGYVVLLFVVLIASDKLGSSLTHSDMNSVPAALVGALLSIGGVLGLTYLFRRRVDRRTWSGMAFPSPHRRLHHLAAGLALGGAMLALVFGVQYAIGGIHITGYGLA